MILFAFLIRVDSVLHTQENFAKYSYFQHVL